MVPRGEAGGGLLEKSLFVGRYVGSAVMNKEEEVAECRDWAAHIWPICWDMVRDRYPKRSPARLIDNSDKEQLAYLPWEKK